MAANRTYTPTKLTSHEAYVAQVRAEGRHCSPFRLGQAVGLAGDNLPSPYPRGSKGDHSYLDGMEYGHTERRIDAKARELYWASFREGAPVPAWDRLAGIQRWPWREKAIAALADTAGIPLPDPHPKAPSGTGGGEQR